MWERGVKSTNNFYGFTTPVLPSENITKFGPTSDPIKRFELNFFSDLIFFFHASLEYLIIALSPNNSVRPTDDDWIGSNKNINIQFFLNDS